MILSYDRFFVETVCLMKNAPRISLKCKAFAVENEYVKDVKHFFIRIITRDHCIDKNSITNRSKWMYIHVHTCLLVGLRCPRFSNISFI